MPIALRLPDGRHIVPFPKLPPTDTKDSRGISRDPAPRGKLVETSNVIALSDGQAVLLYAGEESFKVSEPSKVERVVETVGYTRIVPISELPETVNSELDMAELAQKWENVKSLYRRETTTITHTPTSAVHTFHLSDYRVLDIDPMQSVDPFVSAGRGEDSKKLAWSPSVDFLGVPHYLSSLVPGVLSTVPEMIHAALVERSGGSGYRRNDGAPTWEIHRPYRPGEPSTIIATFDIPYANLRTKWVKKDPWNTRHNAKKVQVADTKRMTCTKVVPASISADSLTSALAEMDALVDELWNLVTSDPVRICTTCNGEGLVPVDGVKEKTYDR